MQKIPESIGSKYRFIILAAERAKQLQNNAKPKIKTRSTKAGLHRDEGIGGGSAQFRDFAGG